MLVPLAQVREPFSAIRWVMERSRSKPLSELLGLKAVKLRRVRELLEAGLESPGRTMSLCIMMQGFFFLRGAPSPSFWLESIEDTARQCDILGWSFPKYINLIQPVIKNYCSTVLVLETCRDESCHPKKMFHGKSHKMPWDFNLLNRITTWWFHQDSSIEFGRSRGWWWDCSVVAYVALCSTGKPAGLCAEWATRLYESRNWNPRESCWASRSVGLEVWGETCVEWRFYHGSRMVPDGSSCEVCSAWNSLMLCEAICNI